MVGLTSSVLKLLSPDAVIQLLGTRTSNLSEPNVVRIGRKTFQTSSLGVRDATLSWNLLSRTQEKLFIGWSSVQLFDPRGVPEAIPPFSGASCF